MAASKDTDGVQSIPAPSPLPLEHLDAGAELPSLPANASDDEEIDGGFLAWTQVAAAFALYFNHLGLITSFGVFQTYYTTHLLQGTSPAAISWIGSIQVFCLMAVGVVIGPLYDAGYCRALIFAGALLEVGGFMLTSISTKYWHVILAQGVCIGLGMCCISIPSIAIVPMYFRTRRATAMATATVGSGLGATVYPLIFQAANKSLGFGWAVRIMGFIVLVTCAFAFVVIQPRIRRANIANESKNMSLQFFIDKTAFKETTYLLFCVGIFFNNISFFNPSYYVQSYALSHGMSEANGGLYILSILNACTIPGRIIPSMIADRVGGLDTFIVVCGLCSACIFYWISVENAAGNISFAVLYGFFSGSVVSLASVVLTSITPDLRRLGTRIGMVSILKGIGSLVGPPISGSIINATGSYLGVQLFSGFGIMLTAVFSLALRIVITRRALAKARQLEHLGLGAAGP